VLDRAVQFSLNNTLANPAKMTNRSKLIHFQRRSDLWLISFSFSVLRYIGGWVENLMNMAKK